MIFRYSLNVSSFEVFFCHIFLLERENDDDEEEEEEGGSLMSKAAHRA